MFPIQIREQNLDQRFKDSLKCYSYPLHVMILSFLWNQRNCKCDRMDVILFPLVELKTVLQYHVYGYEESVLELNND
jgi:hypothetical protein